MMTQKQTRRNTFAVEQCFGGGWEVWDYAYPGERNEADREWRCWGIWGTKTAAVNWAREHLGNNG